MAGTGLAAPTAADITNAKALRRMKIVATGFLLVAAICYVLSQIALSRDAGAWAGYLRAASEAGMVGGLADWFAVTALFRHPLGIPIPHTALIPRRKDQLGESLGGFVGDNFLDPALVGEKVASAHIPERAGQWLLEPDNRVRASGQAAKIIRAALEVLRDEDAVGLIERTLVARISEPEWGPPLGKVLGEMVADGRQEPVVQLLADRTLEWVERNPETIEYWVTEKAPTWAPSLVNELVAERAYSEVLQWARAIKEDPNHSVRVALTNFLHGLSRDLQYDPDTIGRLEGFKHDLLSRPATREAIASAWTSAKNAFITATEDSSSELRGKLDELAERVATGLVSDSKMRASVDDYLVRTASFVAENYAGEITSIISETVERWDAHEASRKIELLAGKDLQFIRINGTVVGALAGIVIHLLTELIF